MTLIELDQPAEKETPVAPYDPLAPHYEAFMGDAPYAEWHGALLALAAEHGVRAGTALDVGCGTGRSLASLIQAGFSGAGSDPSAGMLAVARERLGPAVPLTVAALPDLGQGPRADLVTALNDVINYVAHDELDAAIRSLAARVAPGGVLLFDANTPLTYDGFFSSTFCRSAEGRFFVWESLPAEHRPDGGSTHRADLHAFEADAGAPGRWVRTLSRHVQHHHPHARVATALQAAGLELLTVRGQREGSPCDPDFDEEIHTKRIYLARRP
jgi:SAM-dependent methyltransferase